jgi:hypothetical protein
MLKEYRKSLKIFGIERSINDLNSQRRRRPSTCRSPQNVSISALLFRFNFYNDKKEFYEYFVNV